MLTGFFAGLYLHPENKAADPQEKAAELKINSLKLVQTIWKQPPIGWDAHTEASAYKQLMLTSTDPWSIPKPLLSASNIQTEAQIQTNAHTATWGSTGPNSHRRQCPQALSASHVRPHHLGRSWALTAVVCSGQTSDTHHERRGRKLSLQTPRNNWNVSVQEMKNDWKTKRTPTLTIGGRKL